MLLAVGLAAGCSSTEEAPGGLPDAAQVLREAAEASKTISSAHFTLKVNGSVSAIPVQEADGDLTREGSAKGTVKLTLMGNLFDGEFVLVDDGLYIKGPTGGWQQLPAALTSSLYDPSAILDPARGVPHVLANLKDARTEAREDVGGESAFKVTGTATQQDVSGLVPGVTGDTRLTVWVSEETKRPVKASVELAGEGEPATVDLTLSDVDVPVTVTPPA
ncbi:lipoprotein LprA [Actinokineospora fastidiosa]|uniref:Lipoprotein LprA n=2 Tax=Pseudonocardiaceae TaxID=2070 RepID=A0A918G1T7_9PSEU|nr:lipoprotein LprA [Actinokineospora fastidiosa]